MFFEMRPIFYFLFFNLFNFSSGYKILVFSPAHGRSHMLAHGRIADELALAGHDVTLLEAEYFTKSSEIQSAKYAKTITLGGFPTEDLLPTYRKITKQSFDPHPGYFTMLHIFLDWHKNINHFCELLLKNHNQTLEDLKEQKFDAIFNYHLNLCGTGLKEVLNIKTHFWISTCPIMEYMAYTLGVPTPTSYVPPLGKVVMSDKPTYMERFWNILEFIENVYVLKSSARGTTQAYRKVYGTQFPDVEDIVRDTPITFVTADEILDFPRPILHNTIFIGGLGFKNESKDLEEPYLSEMEKGRLGVVYFSFGTNANTNSMPEKFKKNVIKAFESLPDYHFLAKVDKGDVFMQDLAKKIPNLFISEWFPQREFLAHPRLKAFITHGGYNSLYESARAGVPIITMPFFWDQFRNGKLAERNGWGLTFDKIDLLSGHEEFLDTLKQVLEDSSYQKQAKRTQRLLLTKPFSGTEKFIRYTEFVIENGGSLPELQNEGRNLNLFVYYNLDIFALIFVAFLILCYALFKSSLFIGKIMIHGVLRTPSLKVKTH